VSNITNAVNQHSTYDSKNALSFISDSIEAMLHSFLGVAAVIFIVIICFVALFVFLHHHSKKKRQQHSCKRSSQRASDLLN
jgi:uncharacterized membrane protein